MPDMLLKMGGTNNKGVPMHVRLTWMGKGAIVKLPIVIVSK